MDGAPTIKTAETRERFTSGDWSLEVIPEGHLITAGPHAFVGLLQLASDDDARLMASARELYKALSLLWAETIASGNADAKDYGWPKAREATLAALAKALGEPTPSPNDRSGA